MNRPVAPPAQPAASLEHICKGYPGVQALQAVSLDIRYGEVHAIVGENGAGKSTLLKILSGQIQPDCGRVTVNGVELRPHTTMAARRHGIRVVPQDVIVVPGLTAGRNVALGQERRWASRQRLSAAERKAARGAMRLAGLTIAPTTPVGPLSVPEKRLVQIAQGLYGSGRVLVLDEPTAVVSEADAGHLLDRLDVLRGQGMAILYVSHRLTEVTAIADRVTVLRDGHAVAHLARHEITRDVLIRQMTKVGRAAAPGPGNKPARPQAPPAARSAQLWIENLTVRPVLDKVSLQLRPGRVTGIVGVQGSGHGDFLHALAGLRPYEGRVVLDDQPLVPDSVAAARQAGIRLVPGDRRRSAIAAGLSISDNIALSSRTSSWFGFRRLGAERAAAAAYIRQMQVRPGSAHTAAGALSGGNQQKVAIANALEADPVVLLLEEPTQGVDINGKAEIRRLIRALADSGRCVVIATSEFEEVPEYVDDVYIMRLGRLTGPVPPEKAGYEELLHAALP